MNGQKNLEDLSWECRGLQERFKVRTCELEDNCEKEGESMVTESKSMEEREYELGGGFIEEKETGE